MMMMMMMMMQSGFSLTQENTSLPWPLIEEEEEEERALRDDVSKTMNRLECAPFIQSLYRDKTPRDVDRVKYSTL